MNSLRPLLAGALLLTQLGVVHASDPGASWKPRFHCHKPGTSQPFELTVLGTDAMSVRLRWQPRAGASEYAVLRDDVEVGRTISTTGYFSDFGLRPQQVYQYVVWAYDPQGTVLSRSTPVLAGTTGAADIRTRYTVLALAFNAQQESLVTDETFLKHKLQFLALASLGSAQISLYGGGIVATDAAPAVEPGTNLVDYVDLVTRHDLDLNGDSIVDLVERGAIDHVWVVKSPVDFAENMLIGNRPIQGAGQVTDITWPPLMVKSSRSFFVNGPGSDERAWDAYAHMVEGVMSSISDGHPEYWTRDLPYTVYTPDRSSLATFDAWLNSWEKFRLTDGWNGTSPVAYASPGNGNIGSSHFPPTSPRDCDDYCYYDLGTWQRYIDSSADDWLRAPEISGIRRKLNGFDFGAFNHYAEGAQSYSGQMGASPELHASFSFGSASYHQWWFAHLPHNAGVTNGKLNNWWPYILDFNRFDGSLVDYVVEGFPEVPDVFDPVDGELGTELSSAEPWGYWHSQNGFSPGGKAATLSVIDAQANPQGVKAGSHALKVLVENTQYWDELNVGRNDVFFPVSRNAHWDMSDLMEVRVSIKLETRPELIVGTNPVIRLCKNGGNRIELVPLVNGSYADLFRSGAPADAKGWYEFRVPVAGDQSWEKNVIGYIDPSLPVDAQMQARAQLERDILADVNYLEISIHSTTSQTSAPYDVVSYYIDDVVL